MGQILDARGNEFQGSLDQIGGGTVTDARSSSGSLGALNAELVMDLNGKAVATFEVRSAANSATYVFEATLDGTNYYQIPARGISGVIAAVSQAELFAWNVVAATTIAATWAVNVTGFRRVRCRVSAFTSGSAVVTGRATSSDYAIISQPQPTTNWGTATAAAGTAVTLTLAAPSTGLFHYITSIDIRRATNVAEATAAPLVITTTNITGSPAWTVGAVVTLGGQTDDVRWDCAGFPLKSTVAATATTIVCPDPGTSSIWRVNASFYIGA